MPTPAPLGTCRVTMRRVTTAAAPPATAHPGESARERHSVLCDNGVVGTVVPMAISDRFEHAETRSPW